MRGFHVRRIDELTRLANRVGSDKARICVGIIIPPITVRCLKVEGLI
jgi:hypothetical protein